MTPRVTPKAPDKRVDTSAVASHLTTGERQLYADPAAAASQAVDKIAAARVWLLKEKPFFGVLARALEVRPSLEVAAFRLSVDDKLAVNPLVVLELAFPALCARLSHVALHAALGAYARRGPRDALKWNVAHDLAIDPLLRAGGLPTSEGLPDFDLPKGSAAEHYYAALPDGARPDDLWCDVSDPPPKDDAPPAGSFTRQDDPEGSSPGEGDTKGGQRPSAEGEPEPGEEGEERPSDGDDDDPLEARARELQWKMRLGAAMEEEAASGGKTFGDAPAWIDELLEATIEPPPDWSAILQRSISMLARTERSFLRPSRRMAALAGPDGEWPDAVAMPGRRVVPAGRLVAVVDTSASMESADLARFLGALAAVASAEGFDEIRLLQADAEVTRDETVYAAELLFEKIEVVGRGGTDFRPALERLEADARRELERYTVVYLTDLEGTFPAKSQVRALDVLWVTPRKATSAPPFGRAVTMAAQRG